MRIAGKLACYTARGPAIHPHLGHAGRAGRPAHFAKTAKSRIEIPFVPRERSLSIADEVSAFGSRENRPASFANESRRAGHYHGAVSPRFLRAAADEGPPG